VRAYVVIANELRRAPSIRIAKTMWSRLRPARIAALVGVLAGAIGIAAAAPNPKSGEG
jgi:hypothetical protein